MQRLRVTDAETMIMALQDEIRRNDQSRYDHRLHGVLLVAQGMSCPEVARLLGDAPRTLEYWVSGFEQEGFKALSESPGRGRQSRLSEQQLAEVGQWLRASPRERGWDGNLWDGPALSACLKKEIKKARPQGRGIGGIRYGVRTESFADPRAASYILLPLVLSHIC
ncbi:transposase [Verrucomicrobia bacterium LW23]|nr:transposase [Verrucomicrobia bacterium LW23]